MPKPISLVSWTSSGKFQRTLAGIVKVSGIALHSGKLSSVTLRPEFAGKGRVFHFLPAKCLIPAAVNFVSNSPLCTALSKDGVRVRTVEHLLSALEGLGVDNCKIEVANSNPQDLDFEIPILDGSARRWVEEIEKVGVQFAVDETGNYRDALAPYLIQPVHVRKHDSFVVAFPWPHISITYGINFPQSPAIGRQWFSTPYLNQSSYSEEIAHSRTFCVYEEVESMKKEGLINGGSLDNAIVCSKKKGWMNPPLRYRDEPCRHKVLDLIGDLSLFARNGNQGLPMARIFAYKGGHALHAQFVRSLESFV